MYVEQCSECSKKKGISKQQHLAVQTFEAVQGLQAAVCLVKNLIDSYFTFYVNRLLTGSASWDFVKREDGRKSSGETQGGCKRQGTVGFAILDITCYTRCPSAGLLIE